LAASEVKPILDSSLVAVFDRSVDEPAFRVAQIIVWKNEEGLRLPSLNRAVGLDNADERQHIKAKPKAKTNQSRTIILLDAKLFSCYNCIERCISLVVVLVW